MPTSSFRRLIGSAIVLFAAATLSGCGNGSTSTPMSPSQAPVMITIVGMNGAMSFSPANATVMKGQAVAWRNGDTITHAIAQDGGGFSTATIPPGTTSTSVVLPTSGTLPYHCTIHPSMTGTLTVQ